MVIRFVRDPVPEQPPLSPDDEMRGRCQGCGHELRVRRGDCRAPTSENAPGVFGDHWTAECECGAGVVVGEVAR